MTTQTQTRALARLEHLLRRAQVDLKLAGDVARSLKLPAGRLYRMKAELDEELQALEAQKKNGK